jgi:hypothetical protein
MAQRSIDACILVDPVSIRYACGARNMQVFHLRNPARSLVVPVEGPVVLFEFTGCMHLAEGLETVDEIRPRSRQAKSASQPVGRASSSNSRSFSPQTAPSCSRTSLSRRRSPGELDGSPAHMRRFGVCGPRPGPASCRAGVSRAWRCAMAGSGVGRPDLGGPGPAGARRRACWSRSLVLRRRGIGKPRSGQRPQCHGEAGGRSGHNGAPAGVHQRQGDPAARERRDDDHRDDGLSGE